MTIRSTAAKLINDEGHYRDGVFSYRYGYSLSGAVQSAVNHNPNQRTKQSDQVLGELTAEAGEDIEAWEQANTTEVLLTLLVASSDPEQLVLA